MNDKFPELGEHWLELQEQYPIIGQYPELFWAIIVFLLLCCIGLLSVHRRRLKAKYQQESVKPSPQVPTQTPESSSRGLDETATKSTVPAPSTPTETPAPPAAETSPVQRPSEPAPPAVPEMVQELRASKGQSFLERLRSGLSKSRSQITSSLSQLISGKKIDDDLLEDIHEVLYRADIGVKTVDKLVESLRTQLKEEESLTWERVQGCLKGQVTDIFKANETPMNQPPSGPLVQLIVGVNGVGKTTTIGKLAARYLAEDKKVILCAADTYRAAAIDQLQVWADRLGVELIRHNQGSDPAAVAFDAVNAATSRGADVLLIDTAGRLHNKKELMDELNKIHRVTSKGLPGAPHECWLVIDATTGQNAAQQVKAFKEVTQLTGLVVTKLDGTAKGGVVIGISDQFGLPIRYVGVGEKAADLRPFSPSEFAESIF